MNRTVKLFVACVAGLSLTAFAGVAHARLDDKTPPAPAPAAQPKPAEPAKTDSAKKDDKPASPGQGDKAVPAPGPKVVYVKLATSKGDIIIELNNEKAPISTANFLKYVDGKYYDGTVFHRVIKTFMIQGGGFTADGVASNTEKPGTGEPIKNEWQNGLKNTRGSLAMARTNKPDSARAQFFINVVDNPFLDNPRDGAGYAVFGKVVGGMSVVDQIKDVPTGRAGPHSDVPTEAVVIKSATRLSEEEAKKAMDSK